MTTNTLTQENEELKAEIHALKHHQGVLRDLLHKQKQRNREVVELLALWDKREADRAIAKAEGGEE